jgi:hypothetical protein
MELVLRLEQAFGVSVAEDTLQTADSVRDLLAALKRAADRAGLPRSFAESPSVVTARVREESAERLRAQIDEQIRVQFGKFLQGAKKLPARA